MDLIHTVNVMNPAVGQSVDCSRTGSQFSEPSIGCCGYDNLINPVGSQSKDGFGIDSQFFELPLIDEVGQEAERVGFSRFDLNKEPVCDEVSYGGFSGTCGSFNQLSDYLDFDLNAAGNKEESSVDASRSLSTSMGLRLDLNECQKDVIRLFGAQFEVNSMDTNISRPNGHCGFAPDQCMYGMPTAAAPPGFCQQPQPFFMNMAGSQYAQLELGLNHGLPGFCQQPQPFFMNMAGSQYAQLELGLNHGFVVNDGNNGGLWSSVNSTHQPPPSTTLVLFS